MFDQQLGAQPPQKPPAQPPPDDDRRVTLDEWEQAAFEKAGVPENLRRAIADQESSANPNAVSPTGVRGKYGLTRATAKLYNVNRDDPWEQPIGAAKHLRSLYDQSGNIQDDRARWLSAVAKYYGGGDAVNEKGDLSTVSKDGLSNPMIHTDRVARRWASLERSNGAAPDDVQQPTAGRANEMPVGNWPKFDAKGKSYQPPSDLQREMYRNRVEVPEGTVFDVGTGQTKPASELSQYTPPTSPIIKQPGQIREPKPLAPNERRYKEAADLINRIEAGRDRATALFQQADRTPENALTQSPDGRQSLSDRETRRAQAEGELDLANRLAALAQQKYGDLVEAGFAKDSDPNSNRQWAYAKPKQAFVEYFRNPDISQRAAQSTREEVGQAAESRQRQDQLRSAADQYRQFSYPAKFGVRVAATLGGASPDDLQRVTQPTNPVEEAANQFTQGAVRAAGHVVRGVGEAIPLHSPASYIVEQATGRPLKEQVSRFTDPAGKMISDAGATVAPTDPNDQSWFTSKIPSAVGGSLPLVAAGALSGGSAAPVIAGGLMGAGQFNEDLERSGQQIPEDRRASGAALATAMGMLQGSIAGKVFGRQGVPPSIVQRVATVLEMGGQGYAQDYVNDINAKLVAAYDPNRPIDDPLAQKRLEAVALGAIVGAGFEGVGALGERPGASGERPAAESNLRTVEPPASEAVRFAERPRPSNAPLITRADGRVRAPLPGDIPSVEAAPAEPRSPYEFATRPRPARNSDLAGTPTPSPEAFELAAQDAPRAVLPRPARERGQVSADAELIPDLGATPADHQTAANEAAVLGGRFERVGNTKEAERQYKFAIQNLNQARLKSGEEVTSSELASINGRIGVLVKRVNKLRAGTAEAEAAVLPPRYVLKPSDEPAPTVPEDSTRYRSIQVPTGEIVALPRSARPAAAEASPTIGEQQPSAGLRIIERTRQRADALISDGRYDEAVNELQAHREALRQAKAAARKQPGERVRLERQIGQVSNQIGEVRQLARQAAKQASAPTSELPQSKSEPSARVQSPRAEAPLLSPEAVVNPSGGIPRNASEPVNFSRLAERQAEQQANAPKGSKMPTAELSIAGVIKRRTRGEGFKVSDKGEARALSGKEGNLVGLVNRGSRYGVDDIAHILNEEHFTLPDGRPFVEDGRVVATEGEILDFIGNRGRQKASNDTASLNQRLADEEARHYEEQAARGSERLQSQPESKPLPSDEKPDRDYSSTQVNMPDSVADTVKAIASRIPNAELAEKGRENNPHVTVKYGLHGEDPNEVRRVLANEPPIKLKIGKTSVFENDQYDVVKADVDSPDLHRLNKKISDALPHTDTHPDYKPHVTIAYVKKGMGEKYAGNAALEGKTVTLDKLVFSDKARQKTEIPLEGKEGSEMPARRESRPPAPPSPMGGRGRIVPPVAKEGESFAQARRGLIREGERVRREIEYGLGNEGEHGQLARQMFKSSSGKAEHGQDAFFHDPDVKGALGLTRDAEMADVRIEMKRQLARAMNIPADEVSLTQISPDAWRRWATQKRLSQTARAKMETAIERSTPEFVRAAEARLKETMRGRRAGSGAEALVDAAIVAGHRVYQAGMKLATWTREIVRQLGEAVRPHLRSIWEKLQAHSSFGELPNESRGGTVLGAGLGGIQGFGRGGRSSKEPVTPTPQEEAPPQPRRRLVTGPSIVRQPSGEAATPKPSERATRPITRASRPTGPRAAQPAQSAQPSMPQTPRQPRQGQSATDYLNDLLAKPPLSTKTATVGARGTLEAHQALEAAAEKIRRGRMTNDHQTRVVDAADALLAVSRTGDADAIRQARIDLKEVMDNPSLARKIARIPGDLLRSSQTLVFGTDLSFALRQDLFLTLPPSQWGSAIRAGKEMFRSLVSEKGAEKTRQLLDTHPDADLAKRAGLELAHWNGAEEIFKESPAMRLPWIKRTEAGNEAYQDYLRLDTFSRWAKSVEADTSKTEIQKADAHKANAEVINLLTGRAEMGEGKAKKVIEAMNGIMSAPRLTYSRAQLLNPAKYLALYKQSPTAAKNIALALGQSAGVIASLAALGVYSGVASFNLDPDSPDFFKARIGNTRYEMSGGVLPFVKLGYRLEELGRAGALDFIRGTDESKRGLSLERRKAAHQAEVFGRSRLSPVVSLVYDIWKGKDITGAPVTPDEMKKLDLSNPLLRPVSTAIVKDFYDGYKDSGATGMAKTLPAVFGVGVSTYGDKLGKLKLDDRVAGEFDKFGIPRSAVTSRRGEPDSVLKERAQRTDEWTNAYGSLLIDHPDYQALPNYRKDEALRALRRRIAVEANATEPNEEKFYPEMILESLEKASERSEKNEGKRLYAAPRRASRLEASP